MKRNFSIALLALLIAIGGAVPPAAAQVGILRSQVNPTLDAIQRQIRQAVRPHLTVKNPAGALQSISLSQDGKLLALLSADNSIRIFDLQTGLLRIRIAGTGARYRSLAISADDRLIISGGEDGTVAVWDAATGNAVRGMQGHAGAVNAIAVAGDGSFAATAGADGTVRLWNLSTGQSLNVLTGHAAPVLSVAVNRDGSRVLSGGADGRAMLWDTRNPSSVATLGGHNGGVVATGFDASGRGITADAGGYVRLWAPNGGSAAQTFRGMPGAAGASVTGDGRYLAIGDTEGRARIDEVENGQLVKEFAGPSGSSRYVVVDIEHRRVITGGADGMVRIWNLDSGTDIAQIVATLNGWAVVDGQGRFDGSQQGVNDVQWSANQADLPIDNFSQNYYEPGLLAKTFSSQPVFASEPQTAVANGIFLPPQTTLAAAPGAYQAGQSIDIQITATDRQGGIGAVRLYQNGKQVPREAVQSETNAVQNGAAVRNSTYRIQIVAGPNHLEALATSDQNVDGLPATLDIAGNGTQPLPTLHLVTIGINKYKDDRLDLDYGSPDAKAILSALNRTASVFDKVVEYRLIDDAATRKNILDLLTALRGSRPDDELIIYYAGHGQVYGKEWYLIPSDVKTATTDDQMASSISATELREAIDHISAERILLFIDACKSGSSVQTLASALDRKVLREVARDAGVAILAATRGDQLAAELPALGHGAFTYVLLQGIAGQADRDPADGRITADKLLRYSLERLPTLTEQYGILPQVPVAYRRGSDFVVTTRLGG